jgi:hypothetical protein
MVDLFSPVTQFALENGNGILFENGTGFLYEYQYAVYIHAYIGGAWVDLTYDTRSPVPVMVSYGIKGYSVKERVASTGTLTFALDNSIQNSSGLLGHYSPDHTNARSGFDLGVAVRINIVDNSGANFKMRGKIIGIEPVAGLYREKYTLVTVADWMEDAATHALDGIAVQTDQRGDEVVSTVVGNMPTAPQSTNYGTGIETLAYSLQSEDDGKTKPLSVFQKITQSDMSYIYRKGNTTNGETLVYETRRQRENNLTPVATLDDTMVELSAVRNLDTLYKQVNVVNRPVEIDDYATTVLATLQKELEIPPGQTRTFILRYRDSTERAQRVSGTDIVNPLIADTDYKFSSLPDSELGDMNADLDITVAPGGNTIEITAINNSARRSGYLNPCQVRGRGIYQYDDVTSTAVPATVVGSQVLQFAQPYLDNPVSGERFARWIATHWGAATTQIATCEFVANSSAALMTAAATVEIGDCVSITETVTGIDKKFHVMGIELTLDYGKLLYCSWILQRTDETVYAKVDAATVDSGIIGL